MACMNSESNTHPVFELNLMYSLVMRGSTKRRSPLPSEATYTSGMCM